MMEAAILKIIIIPKILAMAIKTEIGHFLQVDSSDLKISLNVNKCCSYLVSHNTNKLLC